MSNIISPIFLNYLFSFLLSFLLIHIIFQEAKYIFFHCLLFSTKIAKQYIFTVLKIKKSCVWKFFIKSNDTDSGDATCKICNREVKSGGKGVTTNLRNHLKRNHAGNKEVKLTLGESENSNEKAPNPEQANNLVNLYLTIFTCTP